MSDSSSDDPDLDTQGCLLAMHNAIGAIIRTHPNLQALLRVLEQFNAQQAKSFEQGDAEPKLVEAYEHYSTNFMTAASTKPAPLNVNMDLGIKLK